MARNVTPNYDPPKPKTLHEKINAVSKELVLPPGFSDKNAVDITIRLFFPSTGATQITHAFYYGE